jgi:hypothetical protein
MLQINWHLAGHVCPERLSRLLEISCPLLQRFGFLMLERSIKGHVPYEYGGDCKAWYSDFLRNTAISLATFKPAELVTKPCGQDALYQIWRVKGVRKTS